MFIAGGIVLSGSSSTSGAVSPDIQKQESLPLGAYKSSLILDRSTNGVKTAKRVFLGGMIGTNQSAGSTNNDSGNKSSMESCYSNCHAGLTNAQKCLGEGYILNKTCSATEITNNCPYDSSYKKCSCHTCHTECHSDTIQQCLESNYNATTSNDCPAGYSLGSVCPQNGSYYKCDSCYSDCHDACPGYASSIQSLSTQASLVIAGATSVINENGIINRIKELIGIRNSFALMQAVDTDDGSGGGGGGGGCHSNCHTNCHTDTIQQCQTAGYSMVQCDSDGLTRVNCPYNSTMCRCDCHTDCHTDSGIISFTYNVTNANVTANCLSADADNSGNVTYCNSSSAIKTAVDNVAAEITKAKNAGCTASAYSCYTNTAGQTNQQKCAAAGYKYLTSDGCPDGYSLGGTCPYDATYHTCTLPTCHTDTVQMCINAGYTATSCDSGFSTSTCSYNSSYKQCTCYADCYSGCNACSYDASQCC